MANLQPIIAIKQTIYCANSSIDSDILFNTCRPMNNDERGL